MAEERKQRVLVVGGSGYLGQHLLAALTRSDGPQSLPYDLAFTHHRPIPPQDLAAAVAPAAPFRIDLRTGEGFDAVSAAFGQPDVIVNCAAISVPRECEVDPEAAMAINLPTSLVNWMLGFGNENSLLIHLSTDQVYEGVKSFYKEEDETVPVNMYGKSKIAAEKFIFEKYSNFAILRSSIIYGPQTISPVAKSLPIQWIDSVLTRGVEVEFFHDEYRCPVYVNDVVNVILALMNKRIADGKEMKLLLNVGGPDRLSRAQIAETVADVKGHSRSLIKHVSASSHYTSPVSQKTFSSKEEVLHYLRVTKSDDHISDTSFSEHNKSNVGGQGRNSPEWLPRGWILEIKTLLSGDQVGKTYKAYFDPFSGSRFYSKSEVLRFLKSGNLYTPASGEKQQRFKANATDNVLAQIEYSPVGLPQGWIKETKFRKSNSSKGIRQDPYYTDPVSGYVFRSLKDAIHFVETGERGPHTLGPRKCSINEMYSLEKESPLPIPVKELTSPRFTRRCRFTEEASTSIEEDIQQTKVGTDKKRRRMLEAEDPVNTSNYGEQKTKRVRPPKKGSELQKEKEGSEEFLEPAMIVEKSSEPPTEVTPVAREKQQRRSKGELASLPRRSSKRLAGLEAAPATDLVIHRPSCQPRSNGRSNRIGKSVPFAEPGRMETVATSLAEHLPLTEQTYEDKPPSHQLLSNGWFKGIEESAPVKEPERKDTAYEASQGEQMLLTGQTSEAKPPSGQPLSNDWCNGIDESAPMILIEPERKDTANAISQGERVLLTERTYEDQPSSSQLLSNGGCNGFKESAPLTEDTADEASQREQVLPTGQTSEDGPPSGEPLSNGGFKGIEESALSVEPERMDAAEGASQGEQVLLTGQTSQDRPSSPLALTFGNCWDDPCIQFAVKTLTGEIPVLDVGIDIDEYVKKQLSSAEVLNPSPSAASVASDNQDFDLAKLLGQVELPKSPNLPVNDEGKPCPMGIGLPSRSEASRARGSTSRFQG